jgi:diacylglycerol kinase
MANDQTEAIWTGRSERGWRRDLQAAKEANQGFLVFLRECRPVRYHLVLHLLFAGLGIWRGWGQISWMLFALVIALGLIGEVVNSTFEKVGNKFTRVEDGPDGEVRYRYDPEVRDLKHSAAAVTTVIFLIAATFYIWLLISPL